MIKVNKCGAAFLFVVGVLSLAFGAWASPVTTDDAATAVGNWLAYKPQLGCRLGASVAQARTCMTTNGASFHVVKLEGGGFVVTSADTENEPIIAFSESDDLVESEKNPLWVMIQRDFSALAGTARQLHATMASASGVVASTSEQKWARLLPKASTNGTARLLYAATGAESISDVRVAPLLKTKWSQTQDSLYSNLGDPCYNYYTPNNYPCGCVATATAQVMRYHEYPTASVTPGTYECYVNRSSRSLTMAGGTYNWEAMPLVPADGTTEAQRQAIGKLTSDIGISCSMWYYSSGSSAGAYMTARCLPERFGYASAVAVCDEQLIQPSIVCKTLRSNLDAKLPVICGLSAGRSADERSGHAVVADGYGYSMSTFYVHFNFGWAGEDDAWYAPPNVAEYKLFETLVFNVYPEGLENGVICSGRVTDGSGLVLANADVSARGDSSVTVKTDANGIYSFILAPGSYKIVSGNASQSVILQANVGMTVNDDGRYMESPYAINNLCDVDLTVTGEEPEVVMHTVTFDLGAHGTRTGGGALTQTIEDGSAATAPTLTVAEGWKFTGWDKSFDVVTSDLTVTALYEETDSGSESAWLATKAAAESAARTAEKRIVLVWGRDTCGNTAAAKNSLMTDATIRTIVSESYVLWFCDCDGTLRSEASAYLTGYRSITLPLIAVIDPADMSTYVDRTTGYQSASAIAAFLRKNAQTQDPPAVVTHTVTFDLGAHGTRTGGGELSQTIEDGAAAVAPTVEAEDGWTFKGWDVDFSMVTGDLIVRAIYEAVEVTQTINLNTGWNWISLNVMPKDASIGVVFAGVTFADEDIVKSADGAATYAGGTWYGELTTIKPGVAYMVKKSTAGMATISVTGSAVATSVDVQAGWNWIGPTATEEISLDALTHSGGFTDEDVIKSADSFATYLGGKWYGGLKSLKPGIGYRAKFAKGGTLIFGK